MCVSNNNYTPNDTQNNALHDDPLVQNLLTQVFNPDFENSVQQPGMSNLPTDTSFLNRLNNLCSALKRAGSTIGTGISYLFKAPVKFCGWVGATVFQTTKK